MNGCVEIRLHDQRGQNDSRQVRRSRCVIDPMTDPKLIDMIHTKEKITHEDDLQGQMAIL